MKRILDEDDLKQGRNNKIKPSLFIHNLKFEEAVKQIDVLISDGFEEFIYPINFYYDDNLELQIKCEDKTRDMIGDIIKYIEQRGCSVYCLKFHMLEAEFKKKNDSVDDYSTKVKRIFSKYAQHVKMGVVFNEVLSVISNHTEKVIKLLEYIQSLDKLASISFSHYEFGLCTIDSIFDACSNICVNWYPAVSWNKPPELPTDRMYKAAFEETYWIQKALSYGKPVIISEIGITPFYEALHSPGTTGRVEKPNVNRDVPARYMTAMLNSGLVEDLNQVWTWFNEYRGRPDVTNEKVDGTLDALDYVWRKYNKVIL